MPCLLIKLWERRRYRMGCKKSAEGIVVSCMYGTNEGLNQASQTQRRLAQRKGVTDK